MKFRFPFDNIMNHRKTIENLAQREFVEAQNRVIEEENRLKLFEKSIADARLKAHAFELSGGNQSDSLQQIHEFIKGQEIRIQRQKHIIQLGNKLVEEKREILREKAIDYKIIEKLKEKKLEAFKKDQKTLDQKRVDDMVTARFKRGED